MSYVSSHHYESWDAFVSGANDTGLRQWEAHNSSHEIRDSKWAGTETFEEAITLAYTGWPEGRKKLAHAVVQAKPAREVYRSIHRDIAGEYPIVPLAAAGDPMAMVTPKPSLRAASPVISIVACCWYNSGVTPKQVLNRGAALLSIVDSLENAGYSVELSLAGRSDAGGQQFHVSVDYKRAGEALDIDRAAFALLHAATLRRLAFAVMEQDHRLENAYGYGYGTPNPVGVPVTEGAIYIGAPGAGHDDTIQDARTYMERVFADYLERE
jgi:hypothetical protein